MKLIELMQPRTVRANENDGSVDPKAARQFLFKASPIIPKLTTPVGDGQMDEDGGLVTGATVAFISIAVGGHELSTIGPLDFSGAQRMVHTIEADVERAYTNTHPQGWTDGSGTVYMLDDWDITIDSCHSSECNQIISDRMDAAQARKDRIAQAGGQSGPAQTRGAPPTAPPS